MKSLLLSFSPFRWLKKGSYQLLKICAQVLVNNLEDKDVQEKCELVNWLVRHDPKRVD